MYAATDYHQIIITCNLCLMKYFCALCSSEDSDTMVLNLWLSLLYKGRQCDSDFTVLLDNYGIDF